MDSLLFSFKGFRETDDEKVYDCGDGCFLKLYHDVSRQEYDDYVSGLVSGGFTVLQRNELCGNVFTALESDVLLTLYYVPAEKTMRMTASSRKEAPCFTPQSCDGGCETAFYAFENDQTLIDCGMCLLIQCPDYSFFVVDSGHYFQINDNGRIHKFMRERTPDGRKIVVNGWLVTHSHTDHVSKLMDFLRYNCDDVIIEGFYLNLLSDDCKIEGWEKEERSFNRKLRLMLGEKNDIPKYKLHAGQRFYIRNLCFDVLCTHEELYPEEIKDFNDTSAVVMLTAENTRIFIPGDASDLASGVLERRFDGGLKCDVVQFSHHGHHGLTTKVYERLDADTVVFPITRIKFWEEYPRIEANRRAIELADEYYITSDGTVKITLPYEKGKTETLPDETFEDFAKIKRLWGYDYTDEYKKELYELFIKNGGKPDEISLPVDYLGFSIM